MNCYICTLYFYSIPYGGFVGAVCNKAAFESLSLFTTSTASGDSLSTETPSYMFSFSPAMDHGAPD